MNCKIEEIKKVNLDPEDVVLVRVKVGKTVTGTVRSSIREQFHAAFPNNKVIVYDNETLDIKIYKAMEALSNGD